jgi:hypothetical protein
MLHTLPLLSTCRRFDATHRPLANYTSWRITMGEMSQGKSRFSWTILKNVAPLTAATALLLIAAPAAACPQYIACANEGREPCEGVLKNGLKVDTRQVSFGPGGIITYYDERGVCFEICTYDVTGPNGESYEVATYDWGCNGSGTAITVSMADEMGSFPVTYYDNTCSVPNPTV